MEKYAKTEFKKKVGSRDDVWNGIASQTSGGLRKKDLIISISGKIVSKKASNVAKERMKSGKGLCDYCIKQYLKNKSENKMNKSENKKNKMNKSEKKPTLKIKKPKGISKEKVKELEKEIEKLREKAGKIAEKEGRITKEVKIMLDTINTKVKELVSMKKALREKNQLKK